MNKRITKEDEAHLFGSCQTVASECKKQGVSVKDVLRETQQSRQTLANWVKHKPKLFEIVLIGVVAKLDQEWERT